MILFLIYLIFILTMMHCRCFIEHTWLHCQNLEVSYLTWSYSKPCYRVKGRMGKKIIILILISWSVSCWKLHFFFPFCGFGAVDNTGSPWLSYLALKSWLSSKGVIKWDANVTPSLNNCNPRFWVVVKQVSQGLKEALIGLVQTTHELGWWLKAAVALPWFCIYLFNVQHKAHG